MVVLSKEWIEKITHYADAARPMFAKRGQVQAPSISNQSLTTQPPTTEQTAALNHAIRIEQQAQILSERLQEAAGISSREPREPTPAVGLLYGSLDAVNLAKNMQTTAIGFRQAMMQNQTLQTLTDFQTRLADIYNSIINTTSSERNYEPLRLIRQSLIYLQAKLATAFPVQI